MEHNPDKIGFVPSAADALAAVSLLGFSRQWRNAASAALRRLARCWGAPLEAVVVAGEAPWPSDADMTAAGLSRQARAQLRSDIRRVQRDIAHLDAAGFAEARRIAELEAPSLADAAAAVRLQNWERAKRKRTLTALDDLAKALHKPHQDVALHEIEPALKRLTRHDFGKTGVSAATFGPMKSRIRAAAALITGRRPTLRKELTGGWHQLWCELEKAFPDKQGWRIAEVWPIASYCARHDLPLEAVCDETLQAMLATWETKGDAGPLERARRCVGAWNRLVGSNEVPSFPRRVLTALTRKPRYTGLTYGEMPEPFREAWSAYTDLVSKPIDALDAAIVDDGGHGGGLFEDILAEVDREDLADPPVAKSLMPGTIRNHKTAILRAATAAVSRGLMRLEEIVTVEQLLVPAVLAATLEEVTASQRRKAETEGLKFRQKNSYLASICDSFASLGWTFDISESTRERFARMRDRVDPRILKAVRENGKVKRTWAQSWMGPHHQRMLQAFSDESKLRAWFALPGVLVARAERQRRAGIVRPQDIVDVEIAIVCRILREIPVRRANIGGATIYGPEPTIRMPAREGMEAFLYWAPEEVKNLVEIEAELDPETVQLLRLYLAEYRPLAVRARKSDPENPFLFPGRGVAHKSLCKLEGQFADRCWDVGGFRLDLQCCRHLAAKIILDQDPSLIELMSQVLNHRSVETTRRYYIRIKKLTALRRYQTMLKERIAELLVRKPVWRITNDEAH